MSEVTQLVSGRQDLSPGLPGWKPHGLRTPPWESAA